MNNLRFFIPMENVPTITNQEHRVKMVKGKDGKMKPLFYEDQKLTDARDSITLGLMQYGLKGIKPNGFIYGKGIPLSLNVKWCFKNWREKVNDDGSISKVIAKGKEHGNYRITKPDTDNLQKMLKDCMTDLGFWYDDCQVVEEHIGKYWSDTPGIWISIDRLD